MDRLKSLDPARPFWCVVTIAVALTLVAVGCVGQSDRLSTLKDDELWSHEFVNGTEVRTSERDLGTALGKPTHPRIQMVVQPLDESRRLDLLDEAVAAAIDAGWSIEEVSNGYSGAKTPEGSAQQMSVFISFNEAVEGTPLIISMSG